MLKFRLADVYTLCIYLFLVFLPPVIISFLRQRLHHWCINVRLCIQHVFSLLGVSTGVHFWNCDYNGAAVIVFFWLWCILRCSYEYHQMDDNIHAHKHFFQWAHTLRLSSMLQQSSSFHFSLPISYCLLWPGEYYSHLTNLTQAEFRYRWSTLVVISSQPLLACQLPCGQNCLGQLLTEAQKCTVAVQVRGSHLSFANLVFWFDLIASYWDLPQYNILSHPHNFVTLQSLFITHRWSEGFHHYHGAF